MILQSPPVWWSGLKDKKSDKKNQGILSTPVWWSGLKVLIILMESKKRTSPPVWWSGLKVFYLERRFSGGSLHLCGGVD